MKASLLLFLADDSVGVEARAVAEEAPKDVKMVDHSEDSYDDNILLDEYLMAVATSESLATVPAIESRSPDQPDVTVAASVVPELDSTPPIAPGPTETSLSKSTSAPVPEETSLSESSPIAEVARKVSKIVISPKVKPLWICDFEGCTRNKKPFRGKATLNRHIRTLGHGNKLGKNDQGRYLDGPKTALGANPTDLGQVLSDDLTKRLATASEWGVTFYSRTSKDDKPGELRRMELATKAMKRAFSRIIGQEPTVSDMVETSYSAFTAWTNSEHLG